MDDRHVRAFAREQHRDRAADARVAAGDQRRKALQLAATAILGRFEPRLLLHARLEAGLVELLRRMLLSLFAYGGLRRPALATTFAGGLVLRVRLRLEFVLSRDGLLGGRRHVDVLRKRRCAPRVRGACAPRRQWKIR